VPLLLLVNARDMDAHFQLPPGDWVAELDSTAADGRSSWRRTERDRAESANHYELRARSVVLLRDAGAAACAGPCPAGTLNPSAP
jgi:glycogen operon protein